MHVRNLHAHASRLIHDCPISGQRAALLVMVVLLLAAAPARAVIVGGGGSSRTECLSVFDANANYPEGKLRQIRCVDGDPSCDADATVNGVCNFPLIVCANSTFSEKCDLNGVREIDVRNAEDNGDPKFDPDFLAVQDAINSAIDPPNFTPDECTNAVMITVPIEGPIDGKCRRGKKRIKIDTESEPIGGRVYKDRDKFRMRCDPATCDPLVLFGGTFDRIQKQIFNQTCAVSGCHDSESREANLLLEEGAAIGNLINFAPNNSAAFNAGWLRVNQINATTGDPETSFLVRKVHNDLPGPGVGDFGDKMPFGKKQLVRSLRDIITLWVTAGAPENGWVPGTDQ